MQLMAQAVPTATRLPCVLDLPYGWGVSSAETIRGIATFSLGVSGTDDVTVWFTPSCPVLVAGDEQIPVEGGCVTYRANVDDPSVPSFRTNGDLTFIARTFVIGAVAEDGGRVLCGALAPPCP
jgi:hypothetical protein